MLPANINGCLNVEDRFIAVDVNEFLNELCEFLSLIHLYIAAQNKRYIIFVVVPKAILTWKTLVLNQILQVLDELGKMLSIGVLVDDITWT